MTLTDGSSYDLGASTSATVTIADQPVPDDLGRGGRRHRLRGGRTGLFRFTRTGDVTLQPASSASAAAGRATNSSDYSNISTTLTFPAGQATLDRSLVPVNDALIEGTETVSLTVVDGANYDVVAPVTGSIDILDQPIPIVTITAIDPAASETGPDAACSGSPASATCRWP